MYIILSPQNSSHQAPGCHILDILSHWLPTPALIMHKCQKPTAWSLISEQRPHGWLLSDEQYFAQDCNLGIAGAWSNNQLPGFVSHIWVLRKLTSFFYCCYENRVSRFALITICSDAYNFPL